MPIPSRRSRTLRRVYIKTPGNKNKILYKLRRHSRATCSNCGKILHGIKTGQSSIIRNISKSGKNPKRMFAGILCSSCTKLEIIKRVRK